MKIRGLKLKITTDDGEFGFSMNFASNLTIIRGGNSSGKSTAVNSLLFGLGMEELIGGRSESVLPYGVKDHFDFDGKKIPVVSSEVLVELENASHNVVTLRRAIRDEKRSHKLIEVLNGAVVTSADSIRIIKSTYLFDQGAAQLEEGFHKYLEDFIGLRLPRVASSNGGETKLYLQTIFAALAVEQKRGWSDYLANIPFYGIRDAKSRVVEFLLGLDVFESNALRNRLNSEASDIASAWEGQIIKTRARVADTGLVVTGLPEKATAAFDFGAISIRRRVGTELILVSDYIESLRKEFQSLAAQIDDPNINSKHAKLAFEESLQELQKLTLTFETISSSLSLLKAAKVDYERLLAEASEDLERNKATAKLRSIGASLEIASAKNLCPTCDQPVDDSLLSRLSIGPQMDLDQNIRYLGQQTRMLNTQIAGTADEVRSTELSLREVSARIDQVKEYLAALRADVSSGTNQSRANIKRQYQIEAEAGDLRKAEDAVSDTAENFRELAGRLSANQAERKKLPDKGYSDLDESKLALFQKNFRANASSFGYESAEIKDIEINRESLTPYLAQMELKELKQAQPRTELRADSSASDFVRLIWSYLIALYQTSSNKTVLGNHPSVLIFDEPGQHSMRVESQRALLRMLGAESGLQSIVAASFDESQSVFNEATDGAVFKLIQWEGKLIGPIADRIFRD